MPAASTRRKFLTALAAAATSVGVLVPAAAASPGRPDQHVPAQQATQQATQQAPHTTDGAQTKAPSRQAAFATAAREFSVPAKVLLAVSYGLTRWNDHHGNPSRSGAYGPMALTQVTAGMLRGARGPAETARTVKAAVTPRLEDPSLHTLDKAADLLNVSPGTLKREPRQNIRGGAALLAHYARQIYGTLPDTLGGWYAPVARYSGSDTVESARMFADYVFATIDQGAARTTNDGEFVRLEPTRVSPRRHALSALDLEDAETRDAAKTECPPSLDCRWVPAAYEQNDPDSVRDYGNYDQANRPDDLDINSIVIHNTEVAFSGTLDIFQNSRSYVSAHYVLRSSDGQVVQMVRTEDVAWQAGNWYVNMHSIGIEHEGFAVEGATWFTEKMYRSSARLVRYLAQRFDIPLDRTHILGHDNVPAPTAPYLAGMHWDTGPFWDWGHYMKLLRAPIHRSGPPWSPVVTIRPRFETNQPPVTACDSDGCRKLPRQPSNFVYLRKGPSSDAPLLSDPALHPQGGPGTTRASDWGDKAVSGQQYVVAERQGTWTAIWYSGKKAWFHDPAGDRNAVRTSGKMILPKPGRGSIPVYGRAYPEKTAYDGVPVQDVVPLKPYEIEPGQLYVTTDKIERPTYYYAKSYDGSIPHDRTVVRGHQTYYLIQYNHRTAYVQADDVLVLSLGEYAKRFGRDG